MHILRLICEPMRSQFLWYKSPIFSTVYTYCGVKTSNRKQETFNLQSFFRLKNVHVELLLAHSPTHPHLVPCCLRVCPLLTGSRAVPRLRRARGTAAWPPWRIWCSHCGKSRPSSRRRRRPSCPTRQSWTPQC